MGVEVAAGLVRGAEADARVTARHPRYSAGIRWRPHAFGLLASLGLSLFYLGTITLAQIWEHALTQLGEDLAFVATLVVGFGLQVGLLTYLRALEEGARKAGVAASGGASGVAMLACCAPRERRAARPGAFWRGSVPGRIQDAHAVAERNGEPGRRYLPYLAVSEGDTLPPSIRCYAGDQRRRIRSTV